MPFMSLNVFKQRYGNTRNATTSAIVTYWSQNIDACKTYPGNLCYNSQRHVCCQLVTLPSAKLQSPIADRCPSALQAYSAVF